MCAAPISAGEDAWTAADGDWERLQEEAAAAFAAGDLAGAAERWAAALRIARAGFAADDPRLATSLANHATALRQQGAPVPPGLWEDARAIWDAAPAWLARQRLAPRARSSLFHLRLEAKHRGAYDLNLRRRAEALLQAGRAATVALASGAVPESPCVEAWRRARPAGFDALRKVIAARHLVLTAPDRSPAAR